MNDLTFCNVETLATKIKEHEVSPVEVASQCIDRIKELQPELNAIAYFDEADVLKQAKEAEHEIMNGSYKGLLHGIPVAYKDLYYIKGIPTTAGSKVLKDFVPDRNATIVNRMFKAGTVLLGKTNTQEFAIGPTSEDSIFGPTRNPWNPKKIPGGSSGGSAVAAATGMAYIAMGTDTGGSIRIPSSMCGVVGYKPTYGLTSLNGIVPMSMSMDCAGPLCRSVKDAAIAVDAITGTDYDDPCPKPIRGGHTDFYQQIKDVDDLKEFKIGVPTNFFLEKTDYAVEKIYKEVISKLKELHAEIIEVQVPLLELLDATGDCLVFCGATYLHRKWYPKYKDLYSEGVADRLAEGFKYSAIQYVEAEDNRTKMKLAWEKIFRELNLNAMIIPTCPIEAFDIGLPKPWLIESRGHQEYGKAMCSRHTRLANVLECPALTIPGGLTDHNLPVGVMLMGCKYGDADILKVGAAYEKHYSYPQVDITKIK